ncbi:MAG: ATP-binding protein, partial [Nitrospirae bacterium]|nr:ATP-binding protein [Nitrospirota bacterium]
QLTEAVQQVPGAMLVATLPASKYEVAQSEKGQEAFVTLEKRYQRYGADLKLVSDEEIFQVVRTRLFESVIPADDPDYPRKLSQAYVNMYKQHSGEVPDETTKATYRDLIEKSFPFHPSLIDALYRRWGSHPDFQRTRGVLRLLASIVSDLWQKKAGNTRTQHLIQPCHINWSIDALQAALTRYWGIAYQSVCAEDIIGSRANSGVFDEERGGDYQNEGIGQGLVAAILLGSFGGQAQKAGMNSKEIKLTCSRLGLNWNYTDGALLELEERCFFLYSTSAGSLGKRYWFGTKPTLNKLIVQYRQQTGSENFDNDILEALKEQAKQNAGGASWRVVVNPEADLPEQKSLVLLIIHPSTAWNGDKDSQTRVKNYALQLSSKCGGKERLYRNTLLFLAPTQKGLGKLRNAFRERAALAGVQKDFSSQLDDDQKAELKKKIDIAEKALLETMGPAYTIAVKVTGQDAQTATLSDARPNFGDHLGYLWTTLVEDEEWILRRVGSVTLQKTGIVPESGGMRVKDAIDVFLRYTDKPMIASKDAVVQGLAQACKDGVIGIARGVNLTNLQSRSCREQVFIDPNEDGLWIIPPFVAEEGKGEVPGPGAEGAAGTATTTTSETGASTTETAEAGKAAIQSVVIKGQVPLDSWGDIFRCFVNPAARMQLKKLNLGIQFEIEPSSEHPIDKNDPAFKAMQEAAKQLGLKIEIKE